MSSWLLCLSQNLETKGCGNEQLVVVFISEPEGLFVKCERYRVTGRQACVKR